MLSDSGPKSNRRESRSNVMHVLLFLLDFLQLSAILVSVETGWSFK